MKQPPPEDKSWAWVLERPCTECGFDAASVDRGELAATFRSNAAAWRGLLSRGPITRQRPPDNPDRGPVWSALEYGAHVRDVYRVFVGRIEQMLLDDDPTFADWDQDQAAIDEDYASQEPSGVAYTLAVNAGKLADIIDRLHGDQWDRQGRRDDGTEFTVESLLVYVLHDVTHHVADVEAGYEALTEDE